MTHRWLLRMSKWARKPPSEKQVKLVLLVITICLALFAYERIVGLPDWIETQRIKPVYR